MRQFWYIVNLRISTIQVIILASPKSPPAIKDERAALLAEVDAELAKIPIPSLPKKQRELFIRVKRQELIREKEIQKEKEKEKIKEETIKVEETKPTGKFILHFASIMIENKYILV